eukprot:scaffold47984_cov18-Tisochrysis_lutea.AAC.1
MLLSTSLLPLILWSTQCEGELSGLFELVGQRVTKITSGTLDLRLAWSGIIPPNLYPRNLPEKSRHIKPV